MRLPRKLGFVIAFGAGLVSAQANAAEPVLKPPCELLPEYEAASLESVHALYRSLGPSAVCKMVDEKRQDDRAWWSWRDTAPEVATTIVAAGALAGAFWGLHPTS